MPVYAYKVITGNGGVKESRMEAASESQARSALRSRGERVVQIREVQGGAGVLRPGGKKVPSEEIAAAMRQLAILAKAGIPLVESLKGLSEQAKSPILRSAMDDICNMVSQGSALSEAFSRYPNVFPGLAVEMAKVAEAGGNLPESLERLSEHLETSAEIGRKIKSALAYPVVVLIISVLTVVAMVTFILPRFTKLFGQMGAKLPWTTKMLMTVSHLMTSKWYIFVGLAVAAVIAYKRYAATPNGRKRIDAILLKLPIAGEIITKVVMCRVLACISTLLSSGVPMVKTLETAGAAANNEIVREALNNAKRDVAEGSATSDSLRATGLFPSLVLQMVASGEKTGELPAMLNYVCTIYSRETDAKVKSLTSIIEPIMIVVLGLIVAFIAMSVIIPIYSLVGGVK